MLTRGVRAEASVAGDFPCLPLWVLSNHQVPHENYSPTEHD
jgi:hypothetical protein